MNAPNPAATEATATEATAATQATAATEIAATAASAAPEVPALTPIQASEGPAAAPPAATASPQKSHQVLNQALQHLSSGKRNLLVNDVNAAVTALAESCQLLGQHYGETAVECAESYFYYGKALLELARMENGVLDNVMTGDESEESAEDEDAEEVDQPSPETDDTKKEVDPEAEGGETEKSTEGDEGNTSQDDDSQEEENGEADGNESIGSNEAGTSDNKEAKDKSATENEEEEDPSNLQLAWEMFELSKICFQKHADSLGDNDPKRMEMENRLCEAYQMLGELSVESENYPQAIDDLTSCLRRRQELLPNDSRCIAETHYQMGVALGFSLEFDKAVEALNDAIGVLQTRIDNLKNKTESDDPMSKKDAFYTREKEITEIESLIPEIKEKIADTKDMQNETVRKLGDRALLEERELEATSSAAAPKTNGEASTTNGFGAPPKEASSGSKPTSDISNLIKKRKKSESEEVPVTKKSHVEANGTNGAAKTVENGDGDAK